MLSCRGPALTSQPSADQDDNRAFVAPASLGEGLAGSFAGAAPVPTSPPTNLDDDRQAMVVAPDAWGSRSDWPLVNMLHGYGGTAAGHMRWLELGSLVDELGFVVVASDGTPDRNDRRFWDAGTSCCAFSRRVDDIACLREWVDRGVESLRVDRERVYILGHSNGGFMGWTLAFQAPDLVAGVVSIAGAAPIGSPADCVEGWERVAVLQIHGTADDIIHPDGGLVFRDPGRPPPGALASMQAWADAADRR